MLLTLEGWVRRMATAHGGGASSEQQHVEELLVETVLWLSNMSRHHLVAVQRLHGEAGLSGAELRMQLSAAATLLKHRGLAINAAQPLTLLTKLLLQTDRLANPGDAASAFPFSKVSIPHFHLHAISLYITCHHKQPGVDWGLSASPLDPLPSFTDDVKALAGTVLFLHGIILKRLSDVAGTVHLGSHALAVMAKGPVWAMFMAAARVSLHPGDRLHSGRDIDAEGCHFGIAKVIAVIAFSSSKLMFEAGVIIGEEVSSEGFAASSTAQGSSELGDEEEGSSEGLLLRGQRRSNILACVSAAHALLHSEALSCLVGQLWHIRVHLRLVSHARSLFLQPGASGGSAAVGSCDGEQGRTVGQVLFAVFSDLHSVMGHAFSFASRSRPRIVEGEDSVPVSEMTFGLKLLGDSLFRLEVEVASDTPLTFLDVPTQAQAGVREDGLSILAQLRSLATELLAVLHSNLEPDPGSVGTSWSQWEVLQAALLRSLPSEQREDWGKPLVCCNPGCTNLSGPSELQLKTHACGSGCGVRYCSRECQVQGWRLGHRHSCGEIAAGRTLRNSE